MRIDVLTGLPKLLESPLQESILRRAQDKKLVEIVVHDLRDYTHDKHKTIDDSPYGGGAGMVLKPEPVFECVEALMTPASTSTTSQPSARTRSRRKAHSSPLVSSVPTRTTVATGWPPTDARERRERPREPATKRRRI